MPWLISFGDNICEVGVVWGLLRNSLVLNKIVRDMPCAKIGEIFDDPWFGNIHSS